MASIERIKKLDKLVKEAGTDREAAALIQTVKGVAPTHSAIYKARKSGAGTDYVVQCYIEDLTQALSKGIKNHA